MGFRFSKFTILVSQNHAVHHAGACERVANASASDVLFLND
jgi:hypothetical protein